MLLFLDAQGMFLPNFMKICQFYIPHVTSMLHYVTSVLRLCRSELTREWKLQNHRLLKKRAQEVLEIKAPR